MESWGEGGWDWSSSLRLPSQHNHSNLTSTSITSSQHGLNTHPTLHHQTTLPYLNPYSILSDKKPAQHGFYLPPHPSNQQQHLQQDQERNKSISNFPGIPTRLPPPPCLRRSKPIETTSEPPIKPVSKIPVGTSINQRKEDTQPHHHQHHPTNPINNPIPQHHLITAMSEFTRLLSEMSRRTSMDEGEEVKNVMKGDGDDYSKYLDFNFSDLPSGGFPQPASSPSPPSFFDFPTTDNLPFSHPDSALTSLLSSFDVPSTDRTNLVSDFESPDVGEYQLGEDEMFPSMGMFQKWDTEMGGTTIQPQCQSTIRHVIAPPVFGNESAFDDVNFSMLDERGVFGLPLFGGIPNPSITQQSSPQRQKSSSLSCSGDDQGILTATQMENLIAAADGLTKSDVGGGGGDDVNGLMSCHALTASPAEVFAKMTTPIMDIQESFEARAPTTIGSPSVQLSTLPPDGPVRTVSGSSSINRKRKSTKPYEPTGTRSSRPLLDASAPTQTKNYLAPGSTTRKLIPVGFQKKLKLDASTPIDASAVGSEVLDEIDEKRRKNCLAARESRKRKMDYLNGLKGRIGEWEEWARSVEGLLGGKVSLPPMPDFNEIEE